MGTYAHLDQGVAGRGLDNRVGIWAAAEALRRQGASVCVLDVKASVSEIFRGENL